ncbi:MAG: hypothetical protein IJ955_04255 [Oscillospiraceae bacterium]|nr:hypothetical protein [Oscillospiraceae bacterium]
MIRATTNGLLKGYRTKLNTSTLRLNSSREKVLTQRNFNSYAEDPTAAAQSFQLRRAFQQTNYQASVGEGVIHRYETAYSSIDNIVSIVDNKESDSALAAVFAAASDTTGSGRTALGSELLNVADSIVQAMNVKYADNYVFSGADGLEVPFTWSEADSQGRKQLLYRGVSVDLKPDDPNYTKTNETLKYFSKDEHRFADIGVGLKEDTNGNLIETSVFDSALQGINFLGWDVDEDGDPKNIASIIRRMGEILSNCDQESGSWKTPEEQEEFMRLMDKFSDSATELKKSHVALSTQSSFLHDNQELLENTVYNLNEQILDIEQCDLADAITSFSWAQYCYNAALKMGNSLLSESLMDYMK